VDAEKREPRIRHGVDQPTDEVLPVLGQLEVLAAERHDASLWHDSAGSGHDVRLQAGADHQRVGLDAFGRGGRPHPKDAPWAVLDPGETGPHAYQTPAGHDVVGERATDQRVVDDPGRLDPQRLDAGDVGLVCPSLLRRHQPGRHPVGRGSVGELVQARDLVRRRGDDELAGRLDGDASLPGERRHRRGASHRHGRLEAPGGVVDP
jgi:hypothetical protein